VNDATRGQRNRYLHKAGCRSGKGKAPVGGVAAVKQQRTKQEGCSHLQRSAFQNQKAAALPGTRQCALPRDLRRTRATSYSPSVLLPFSPVLAK